MAKALAHSSRQVTQALGKNAYNQTTSKIWERLVMRTKHKHWIIVVLLVLSVFGTVAATRVWNTNKLVIKVSNNDTLPDYVKVCGTVTSGRYECTPRYTTTNMRYKTVTWWFKLGRPIDVYFSAKSNNDPFWPATCRVTLPTSHNTSEWSTITLTGHGSCSIRNGYHP